MAPGRNRGWLLRLVIAFSFTQGAVSMARPAVSYRALALGADERAIGVIAGVYALLPLFAAVPLGRRTDHGRCAPAAARRRGPDLRRLRAQRTANSLWAMAMWSGVMGLGHLCFVIGAQSLVARQSAPHEQDRNFGHFTIGASLGQLIGPIAAGALIGGSDMAGTSALALLVAGAGAAVSFTSLWRIEDRTTVKSRTEQGDRVPMRSILGARGVPAGIFISLSVLSATDILTAYLPVVGEHRGIAPSVIGVLLSIRAAATIACRLVLTPLLQLLGRAALLTATCLLAGVLCAGIALPRAGLGHRPDARPPGLLPGRRPAPLHDDGRPGRPRRRPLHRPRPAPHRQPPRPGRRARHRGSRRRSRGRGRAVRDARRAAAVR
jgi:hypothetical protein